MINIIFKILFFLLFFSVNIYAQVDQNRFKIVVDQQGKGNFKTIQEAVNSVRDHMQFKVTITVKAGIYKEKLVIPSWKKNISIIGENRETTIISGDDFSGKPFPSRDFTGNNKYSTYTSYTVLVQGNDCSLENLTIENTAGRVGQAVALMVEADRFIARNCNVLGNQDTLYTAKNGRNYFQNCLIAGTTDFIFGEATAVFMDCTVKSLSNSYITAASTTPEQAFGYVFFNCKLIAAEGINEVYLGRPWRPFAKTVFIGCDLGKHILPKGWNAWPGDPLFADKDKTAFYAEYRNNGPGADTAKREKWVKILSSGEAKKYSIRNIFSDWNPLINP